MLWLLIKRRWLRPRIGEKRSYDDLVSLMHRAIINTVTDVEPSNEQMEDLTHAKVSISAHGVPEKVDLPESEVWLEGESIIYTPTDTSFLDARLDLSSPIVFEVSCLVIEHSRPCLHTTRSLRISLSSPADISQTR